MATTNGARSVPLPSGTASSPSPGPEHPPAAPQCTTRLRLASRACTPVAARASFVSRTDLESHGAAYTLMYLQQLILRRKALLASTLTRCSSPWILLQARRRQGVCKGRALGAAGGSSVECLARYRAVGS
jgi:hypothetical protein